MLLIIISFEMLLLLKVDSRNQFGDMYLDDGQLSELVPPRWVDGRNAAVDKRLWPNGEVPMLFSRLGKRVNRNLATHRSCKIEFVDVRFAV